MKQKNIQIILFSILCVFVSCKSKDVQTQSVAKPIVKTVGKIDVMVDPNVEMMMILGRLGNIVPYSGEKSTYSHPYLDRVDEYFAPYKEDVAIKRARVFWMTDYVLPEFGMYLKDSEYMGSTDKDMIIELAQTVSDWNEDGYKKEFVELVKMVE